jgi:hypothetical protein
MSLGQNLQLVAEATSPEQFETFQKHMDPQWIDEALSVTGKASVRKRLLPAEQVVWLVIGMGIFVKKGLREVVESLDLVLPTAKKIGFMASSAISQARARLGQNPMRWLFKRSGDEWSRRSADAHRWRGLALFGIDGTTLRVADSQENRDSFGGQSADAKRGASGYPLLRLVALMVLRSHILKDTAAGPYKGSSEASLSQELLRQIPDDSLTVMDRGFVNPGTLVPLARGGHNRHWLTRAKKNTAWKVIRRLGRGDDLVEMKVSSDARKKDPSLPATWTARAIAYQRKGFRPQTLLTSLLDPTKYPAAEIVLLYHERWELELGFDELKTEMLDRQETIRSKTAEGVYQEAWGLLTAYNLIRVEMEQVAAEAGVPPMRISFTIALHLIQDELMWCRAASPGTIPAKLRRLRGNVARFVLPPRRGDRSYPRAVKIKMSNYKRKRPTTTDAPASGGLK